MYVPSTTGVVVTGFVVTGFVVTGVVGLSTGDVVSTTGFVTITSPPLYVDHVPFAPAHSPLFTAKQFVPD